MLAQNSSNSGLIIYNEGDLYLLNNSCLPNNCYEDSGCFGFNIKPFIDSNRIFYPYSQDFYSLENYFISGILPPPYYYDYRVGQPNYYLGGIQNNGTLEWYGDTINRINELNYPGMWEDPYWRTRPVLSNSLIYNYSKNSPYYQIIRTINPIILSYPNYHKYINFYVTPETGVGFSYPSGDYPTGIPWYDVDAYPYTIHRTRIIINCLQGKIKISDGTSNNNYSDPSLIPVINNNETILLTNTSRMVLVSGYGSEDNDKFEIIGPVTGGGNILSRKANINFENKKIYSIRVRASTQSLFGSQLQSYIDSTKYVEKIFSIQFFDIIEPSGVVLKVNNIEVSGTAWTHAVSYVPTITIDNNLPQNSIIGFLSNNTSNYNSSKMRYRIASWPVFVNISGIGNQLLSSENYFKIIDNELQTNRNFLNDDRVGVLQPALFVPNNYLVMIEVSDKNFTDTINDFVSDGRRYSIFNIQVRQNPINEYFSLSNDSIYENNSIDETIGIFTPIDTSESFIYELTNGTGSQDNSFFYVGGSYNNELKANYIFDYETKRYYYIRIKRIEKSNNVSTERNFIITIRNRNDKKPDIILLDNNLFSIPISETTIIGRFSINNFDKYDYYDYYTYSLIPYYDSNGNDISDNSYFFITNENALCAGKLLSKINPIFNTKSNFFINVRATNKEGLYVDNYFNLTASWVLPDPSLKDGEGPYDISLILYKDRYNNTILQTEDSLSPYVYNESPVGMLVAKYVGDDNLNTTYHYELQETHDHGMFGYPPMVLGNFTGGSRNTLLISSECSSGNSLVHITGMTVWNNDRMQVNLRGEIYGCDYLKAGYNYAPYDCDNDGKYNFVPIKLVAQGVMSYGVPWSTGSYVVRTYNYPNPQIIYLNSGFYVGDLVIPWNNQNIIPTPACILNIRATGLPGSVGLPLPVVHYNYLISYDQIKQLICEKIPINGKAYNDFGEYFAPHHPNEYIDFTLSVD